MIDSKKMVEETEKTQKETKVEDKKEEVKEETDSSEKDEGSEEDIDDLKQDKNSESQEDKKDGPKSVEDTKKEKVEEKSEKKVEEEDKDNIIFVGIKPFMNYVTGVVMQFQNKGQDEVIVSARGKFISKAVDVVEVARRTFLKDEDIKIDDIKVSSEQFENKEGRRIFVSAIEIKLIKN